MRLGAIPTLKGYQTCIAIAGEVMFRVRWDPETNGVLLSEFSTDDEINPPRPVFHEELDLLGFNNFWKYRKTEKPLLWAIGRRYYYQGNLVAEAKGGNFFEKPSIVLTQAGYELKTLKPINIKSVIEKNRVYLTILENEAMDFVKKTFARWGRHVNVVAVSFSGGKDSQVVLDIVSRVLAPQDYVVVFSDTTMELPYTYETVESTRKAYQSRYPQLRFYYARPAKEALELWKEFGPPSRMHRWCCTVTKTVPFLKVIKKLHEEARGLEGLGNPKVLVYDGVRAEESKSRSSYSRVALGAKHLGQINAEVIRNWNATEVYLYLWHRGIGLNEAYKLGFWRVGCTICPFASAWSETLLGTLDFPQIGGFMNAIEEHVHNLIGKDEKRVREYIATGQWKKRAGGDGLEIGRWVREVQKEDKIIFQLFNPNEDLLQWLKPIGETFMANDGDSTYIQIKTKKGYLNLRVVQGADRVEVILPRKTDVDMMSKIRKAVNKAAHCIRCEACSVECPTSAIRMSDVVRIDESVCIHCGNCFDVADEGCLLTKSIQTVKFGGGSASMRGSIGAYQTFGPREPWVEGFILGREEWLLNNTLGNKQLESLKVWLREMEFMKKNEVTQLGYLMKDVLHMSKKLVWEVIWTNLYYNSAVCRFYLDAFPSWGNEITADEVRIKLRELYPDKSERTIDSAISSFFNLLDTTPIGREMGIGRIKKVGSARVVEKTGYAEPTPQGVLYSMYSLAEHLGRSEFRMSELFSDSFPGGPYKIFGTNPSYVQTALLSMQEKHPKFVRVEFRGGLDNIHLDPSARSLELLEWYVENNKTR